MRMIPALFVFHNDTCDTLTLDRRYIYVCSSSVTTVITVTTVIKKTDRAVTIGTIKIGAVLSYLMSNDEKMFAADNIFLSASIFAHKVGFAVHYFALANVGRSGASIALWHPPAVCGRSLCTDAGEPAPLILSAKGENSWRENRPSE